MINVYSANETNFNHNGLATLNPLSADLSLEVNGNWVLTLVLPWDREKKYTYVEKNNIIIADVNCVREQASKRQKFRIYDYRKNYNTITVKACPVAFEATFDVPITNLSLVGDNGKISGIEAVSRIQDYVDDVVADKYTITTDVTKTAKADYTNSNLIKAIASSDDNSFINTWGGEVAYDNYDIKIKTALGDQDNASAYPIVYGKNITGVEYGIDVSNVVTRIYPISSDDMRLNAWNDLDATGKSTQQYVDGNTSAYPYIRSAFLVVDRAELIDTNSKSISDTRTHTLAWQDGIINKVRTVAKTLWQEVKKNEDQRFSPEYVQELIPDIVNYVQARYTFSHKGWQSFIKSCIKQGIEWIKDEEIAEWGWKGDYGAWWYGENSEIYAHDQYVLINKVYEYFNDEGYWQDWCRFTDADWHQTSDGTWWYGNKNSDGSTKNFAKSQYIYIYAESKWYEFDGDGFYIKEEIPAETIALLNTYTWREDSTGWYYGDGNGNYLTNSWVESSEGRHYWVGADGYMDETKTDEQSWMWFTQPAKYRYGDYERYFAHNEYVYMTVEGQMKEWWYDKEGWYDDSKSGDSDFAWHGDGSASNPYWFGEEDAGTEDKNKYIHDKWAFIDGTYYWFDEYGYISGDASKAKQNYQWGVQTDTVTGDTWFGNPDRTYEAIYVKNQWLKIDGEWYYFGSDGYKVNMDEKKSEIIAWFGDEIYDETHGYIDGCLEEAYTYLYANMTAWANEQFTNGIDAPAVTVNVSLVDLSKTTEYKNYASFEQICLGDKVEVKALGMSFTERVVGLTYDVIRGYNTDVTIGKMGDTISSLMSTSFSSVESGGTARLIGGDGVKVDGNVISSENVAVTYGIQDATLEGVSIVHGNVARLNDIYRELTQAQYNALSSQEKNSGKLFYITDTQTIMHKGVAYGGGSISYGTSTPTGGSDGDVYFQHANSMPFRVEEGAFNGDLKLHSAKEQVYYFDIYGTPTAGGDDDMYLYFKGLVTGRNYKVIIDFKFADDTHWIGRYNDWIYLEDASGTAIETTKLEDDYEIHRYELSFVGEANNRRLAFYFNNVNDGEFSRATMTIQIVGALNIDWNEPQEIIDIWQKVGSTWYSFLQEPYLAGERITIDTEKREINADAQIICGKTAPTNDIGKDGYMYIKYAEDLPDYTEVWRGSVSTSAWASPVQIGNVVPSDYLYLKVDGVEKAVEEIPVVGSSELWKIHGGAYVFKNEDESILWLYSSTGYTSTVTSVDGIAKQQIPTDVEAVYEKISGYWVEVTTGGGGGSEVIPNPQGTATDTLNTVEIDGTIYDLPSGGGGGGGSAYSIADLISAPIRSTGSFALSDAITKYDKIRIVGFYNDAYQSAFASEEISPNEITAYNTSTDLTHRNIQLTGEYAGTVQAYINCWFTDSTHLCITEVGGYSSFAIQHVYGIKYGGSGGSGGSGYEETTLFDTQTTVGSGSNLTLNDDYTNYDMVIIDTSTSDYVEWRDFVIINVSQMALNEEHSRVLLRTSSALYGLRYKFTSATNLYAYGDGNRGIIIYKIVGVKFGGGGGGSSEINYSTEEQRIGTWIDGSTLYQRTFNCGQLPRRTTKTISMEVRADNIVSISGFAKSASGITIPINDVTPGDVSGSVRAYIVTDSTVSSIVIQTASNDTSVYTDSYITLQYTKPTT